MFFKIALRNVLRNKRRTLLTEAAIVFGVLVLVVGGSFLNAIKTRWSDNLIYSSSGHLTVVRSDYLEQQKSNPLRLTLSSTNRLYEALDSQPQVEASIARLSLGGLIGTESKSTTFFGAGLDLDRIARALPGAFERVTEGVGLSRDAPDGAVLGYALGASMGAKLGDSLLLVANTADGQLNAVEITVRGFLHTGEDVLDNNLVYVSLDKAQQLLGIEGRASEVNIRLKSGVDLSSAQARLAQVLRDLEPHAVVRTWLQSNAQFSRVTGIFDGIRGIVGLILFFIVATGIANSMLMSVFERTREIGTIMAIGTDRRQVVWLFVLESMVIGLFGSIAGMALGIAVTLILNKTGVPMPTPGTTDVFIIRPAISLSTLMSAGVIVVIVSLLAALYPARLASRMNPIEALGHN